MLLALGATLVIGAVAGLYPATRAARLQPTEPSPHRDCRPDLPP
jgi:ABC-type lipoprotein release transport system permease subunit